MLAQQTISIEVTGLLHAFMEQHEINAPDVVKTLNSQNGSITYQQWWDALAALRDLSGIEHIGLALGRYITPEFGGVLGYLSHSSLTLRGALADFERFQHLLYGGTGAKIERLGNNIRCEWQPAYCDSNKESDDTLVAALVTYSRLLTGNDKLAPTSIGFMHEEPSDRTEYDVFFNCKISFNSPVLFIEAPLNLGGLLTETGNPALGKILKLQAESMLSELPGSSGDFLEKVKRRIKESDDFNDVTQTEVSAHLGISSRTLHRKLAEKGIRFSALIDDMRYQMAKQYLDEGELSINNIAEKLGYAEQSAFTRAFKRWSGITPIAYTKRNLQSGKNELEKNGR